MRYQVDILKCDTRANIGVIMTPTGRIKTFGTIERATKAAKAATRNSGGNFICAVDRHTELTPRKPSKLLYDLRTITKGPHTNYYAVREFPDKKSVSRKDYIIRYASRNHAKALAILNRFEQGVLY